MIHHQLNEGLQKDKSRYAEFLGRIPMGRWGEPEELGGASLHLVSDASIYITGQTFMIDGDWLPN